MSDEIDREITTKKVTSHPNSSVDGSRISEQRTTKVSNDNSSGGLILGILLTLAVGAGAVAYFMNNRPATTQILVPGTDTVRENKSTVIERNNTTTKEVAPVTITQPPTPSATPVSPTIQVQPTSVATPVSPPTIQVQPQAPSATPVSPATPVQPQTPVATPRPVN